ncbi:uncharacterized protein LACBIDRAFT_314737 [Laccaria bicolor S238N-H82]|uniref:Predicted protein n=1 Tax=Laccaria bicolor (strain S238N-H82 / ATCC MYA-4686) TaxID=486041 RepID=B0DZ48_LACBS|nr:uncharacterized protein LACBIDRAFT_314737 [Laccaria bicolor S238N-H82]EDR00172.1 predicted protein [Laccaria bicolor S238N-H82]|eukprot:XP_001889229.1 predicted protein [Laccaria bicolor S238N-H82]
MLILLNKSGYSKHVHTEKNNKKNWPSNPGNSNSEVNMRSQKKRRARFTKKKDDSNAADSDDEVRSVGKGRKLKKRKVAASGTSSSTLPLYSSEWSKKSDDSGDEIHPVDLMIFVYVEKLNPPCMAKGKVEESDKYA